uniref:Uncharacterized protein n=1 Tax=Glossina palpalis gambiensis TaxID=67801 RepID=A0A1B0ASI0_9MUSC
MSAIDAKLLILNDIYYDASTWTHAHTSKQHSVTEQQNSDTTGHKYSKGHHMIERKVLDLTTAVTVTPGTTILPTQMNPVCLPLLYVYRTSTSVDYFHSHTLHLSSVSLCALNILNFKKEARVGLYLN